MELLIVALVLFIGMIVCWIVLPAGTSASVAYRETEVVSHTTVEQPA